MKHARISGANLPDWIRLENEAIDRLQQSGIKVKPRVRSGGAGITATGAGCLLDLTRTVVSNNFAAAQTDGHYTAWKGGGIYLANGAEAKLSNCIILRNTADSGGGVSIGGASMNLENSTISDNVSRIGGAAIDMSGNVNLSRCIIARNRATEKGNAILVEGGVATIINTTVYGNTAFVDEYGISSAIDVRGHADITNSVIWGNVPGSMTSRQSVDRLTVRYSDIYLDSGTYQGIGNLNSDPLFVDPENGDFALLPYSSLIDAGDPGSPPDLDGSPADIGAVYRRLTR